MLNDYDESYTSDESMFWTKQNIIKKFGAISPEHISKKKRKLPYNKIEERKTLTGGAMLFETKTFKKICLF